MVRCPRPPHLVAGITGCGTLCIALESVKQVWGVALESCVFCYEKELRQGRIPHSMLFSNHHLLLCVPRC